MTMKCKALIIFLAAFLLFSSNALSGNDKQEDIPRPAREVLHEAQCLMERGRTDAAIKTLEDFKKRGEKKCREGCQDRKGYHHYMVDFFLGSAKYNKGDLNSAAQNFEEAVNKKQDFAQGWLNLGTCCHQCGKMAKAAESYLRGYRSSENKDPSILYLAGAAFLAAGDSAKSVEILAELFAINPESVKPEWKETYAHALVRNEQHKEALPVLEDLAETAPENRRKGWREFLLHEYLFLEMHEKALAFAVRLTEDYPLEPKWWKTLASLHLQRKEYEQALVNLDVYANLQPLTDKEARLAADLYLAVNIPARAQGLYEAIAREKSDVAVIRNLACSWQKLQQPEKALQWVEKGLEQGEQADLMGLKANLLYSLERYREAADAFEKTAEKKHDCGRAWLMAGYSAMNAGDANRAKIALAKAAKYKCHRDAAKKLLAYLEKAAPEQ
ncbi:Tetratricopeptide repeat-containing protein [Desulfatibacillum alkenivorans DSM 16219]|jgi:tetratricopeptide (TPR) repeat protein|uniref:Tetratricopeptide repeat-containing protein n=2 Tax=Desulfatibacillum alkenivorans TaxID=259354 RepID=A0A1M6NB15_9BACT|nr:Tetratricopeptide repeat-containing protein [Desulfatibacillum alkenivorans DSM 16219]